MKTVTKTKAIVLGIVILPGLLVLLFAVALALGRVKIESGEEAPSDIPAGPSARLASPGTTEEEKARWFFESAPLKSYSSFEEAEQVAGYHIPRASPEYPVAFGQTTLQWFPQFDRPISTTQYTYPPLAPTSIQVIVGPSYFSRDGDEALMSGQEMTVGGKSGWMHTSDTSFVFNYLCGEIDGYNVWCTAAAVKEVGWDAFDHFVSTLQ